MVEHFTRFILNYCLKKYSKNSKKTPQWTTSAIWSLFADLNHPFSPKLPNKHALFNNDGGKHVLLVFKLGKTEKNSGLYGIRTLDLCDTSAARYQLN